MPCTKLHQPIGWILAGWLIAGGLPPADAENLACEPARDANIWISRPYPEDARAIRILAVTTDAPATALIVIDQHGTQTPLHTRRRGGPPWSLIAQWHTTNDESYRMLLQRDGQVIACREFSASAALTPLRLQTWDLASEAFYAAWIEELFGAPPEESFSFPSLEPLLRNRDRNFLHNYLGKNEDHRLPLTPDCADLPYTLRAYFAWKTGLPFAYRACNRGSANAPPQCGSPSVITEFVRGASSQAGFKTLTRRLVDTVHSGSARTGHNDEATDYYPIPLKRETLWPGTIFADPYGHILVLAGWVPQTADRPGMLLAVDAQPDQSVARKRIWEGTALFANTANAGPGFKAFRPIVASSSGQWRGLSNRELSVQSDFMPYSLEQAQLAPDGFYAALTRLTNPYGLNPLQAYEAMLTALVEQIETRVNSVNNGEAYFRKHPRNPIAMPGGATIFQTIGPWEDYATPSRDMRLLIAINVLNDLPGKILRHPDLFVLDDRHPQQASDEIARHHAKRTRERSIRYTRSDGSAWELTLAEILARKSAFETAYNPNDCVEFRWGALPDSEEYASCNRRAPAEQRAKMEQYRVWFRETRRPVP
ncbi:MAG: hypothetical protein LZF61_01555 [Nitrosomonas sp.]|nr:MAG: hypothetical protein LZF61_01555 [Nitrosomonas sp.]